MLWVLSLNIATAGPRRGLYRKFPSIHYSSFTVNHANLKVGNPVLLVHEACSFYSLEDNIAYIRTKASECYANLTYIYIYPDARLGAVVSYRSVIPMSYYRLRIGKVFELVSTFFLMSHMKRKLHR